MKNIACVILCSLVAAIVVSPNSAIGGTPRDTTTAPPYNRQAVVVIENPSSWGLDISISNDGYGFGGYYRRQFTPDLYGTLSLMVMESKDDREMDRYDPYTGLSYTPGKLNRFLVVPFMAGVQYRLFREDIVDTFRPFVNGGVGPTMIYVAPFSRLVTTPDGYTSVEQIEFFKSLGQGSPRWTFGSFLGFGAFFGAEGGATLGVNLRYQFTYLLSSPIPSSYDPYTGVIISTKNSFGGFTISLLIGL